jgi:HAD superfamily hydrolase (TIGR01549 family)
MTSQQFREKAVLPLSNYWQGVAPNVPVAQANAMLRQAWNELNMQPQPFKGIQDLLWLFQRQGIKIVVVSSHYCDELRREAKRYGVEPFIEKFHGCVKDKVRAAGEIVQKYNINPEQTLVVGDMAHDIEMGLVVGAKLVVGLTCGYNTAEQLLTAGAHCVRSHPTELACLI